MLIICSLFFFFFFNDTATTEIYTLSLHDALPICNFLGNTKLNGSYVKVLPSASLRFALKHDTNLRVVYRSEEHTSELQSQSNLVCRLLLEKKKINIQSHSTQKLIKE